MKPILNHKNITLILFIIFLFSNLQCVCAQLPVGTPTGTANDPIKDLSDAHYFGNGRYLTFQAPDNKKFKAYISNQKNKEAGAGNGWVLVLNYHRKEDTNPDLTTVHLQDNTTASLPRDLNRDIDNPPYSSDPNIPDASFWGHASKELIASMIAMGANEFRFYAKSSKHDRVIDFVTNNQGVLDYVSTGIGSFGDMLDRDHYTLLPNHTANIPDTADQAASDKHNFALTHLPFYHFDSQSGSKLWAIHVGVESGNDNYFTSAVDDSFGPGESSGYTHHQVWMRARTPKNFQEKGEESMLIAESLYVGDEESDSRVPGQKTIFGGKVLISKAPKNLIRYTKNKNTLLETGESYISKLNNYMLVIDGKTEALETRILNTGIWADYVFEKDYNLKTLEEVQHFITKNKHLPGVPSKKEIEIQGTLPVAKTSAMLLKKIEELTLYLIDENNKGKQLNDDLKTLQKKLNVSNNNN